MSFPNYKASADTANGNLISAILDEEIRALTLTATDYAGLEISGDDFSVAFTAEPNAADQTAVTNAVQAHEGSASLAEYKRAKIVAIDSRTNELISAGFTYASKQFSLSLPAQLKMTGTHQIKDDPALTYPLDWNTIDDLDVYAIANAADLDGFFLTGVGTLRYQLDSGTALKDAVRAATDVAGVDAVADTR